MNAVHQTGEFNGTVLVSLEGTVAYRQAFGFAEGDRLLKEETQFYLGSLAKAFTGMAIMMLSEEDKLAFDDPAIKYFPELPGFTKDISIRHLLNHTSGLPDYYNLGKYVDGMTNEKVFRVIMELDSLEFPPGQQYSYSNTGYVLLSLLIEKVSGQSFREFVQKHIFEPIGMHHSEVFDGNQPAMSARAYGHTQDGESDDYKALTTGAGGIYSQVDDLFL
jgi:CubicO group peptidase (beta-lactamase class C family)